MCQVSPIKIFNNITFECFLVMFFTELCNANACLPYHFFWHSENNSNVIRILKAFARQTKNALLSNQSLHEFELVVKLGEIFNINADHHIHCAVRHYWPQSIRLAEYVESEFGMFLKI